MIMSSRLDLLTCCLMNQKILVQHVLLHCMSNYPTLGWSCIAVVLKLFRARHTNIEPPIWRHNDILFYSFLHVYASFFFGSEAESILSSVNLVCRQTFRDIPRMASRHSSMSRSIVWVLLMYREVGGFYLDIPLVTLGRMER